MSSSSSNDTAMQVAPPPAAPRHAGSRLGRYMVIEELGRGGMSVVYLAYDPKLDRRVALKVVRGDKLSASHRARLHREAQALARLSHPNVVTVFDVGDLDDDTFVAMELVEGSTLRAWAERAPSWREVVRILAAAGRGLAAAHAAGIVHRDVKPHNIMISASGEVKLVDFGLARDLGDRFLAESSADFELVALDDVTGSAVILDPSKHLETITQAGHMVGTPAYMPPEQRGGRPDADERSDQFSFCVTLYEALYKQRPFHVSRRELHDRNEHLTKVDKPGATPRTLAATPPEGAQVPAWLHKIVVRGLAAEPRHRYPSVAALLDELDRDPQRTRRRALAIAAAAVGVAAGAALVTLQLAGSGPTCDDGGDRVEAMWSARTRAELAGHAHQLGVAWADGAIAAFGAGVDRWTASWRAMHLDACRATRARGEQSEQALDLRAACLDRRLGELDALIGVMRDAGAPALRHSGDAIDNLPAIADCADVAALRQVAPPPSDPVTAGAVAALEPQLARIAAAYAVGDVIDAVSRSDRAIASARAIGYAPLLARALFWRGRALADRDGGGAAEAAYDEAFSAALAAGDDKLAADAAARVAQEALWAGHLDDFHRWGRTARALADRTGAAEQRLWLDQLDCMAHYYSGKLITRLACLREVAARRDRVGRPSEWLFTTLGLAATEAGDLVGAIGWLDRGVALAGAQNGADHPRTLEMRAYLCHGLNELGDYARSAADCGDALARLERVAPDDEVLIARLQLYLGVAEQHLGRLDRARALLDAAIANGGDDVHVEARAQLGELAGARGDLIANVRERQKSLDETLALYAPFDPHHPNIIGARHELGVALVAADRFDQAAAMLARADGDADPDEISPLELAQLRFARAQVVAHLARPDLVLARRLAESARALYLRSAPDTTRWQKQRADVELWLAALPR